MPLIKSISGIRGTLKGDKDSSLNPDVIKNYTSSFIQHLKNINKNKPISIAVGRDGRISGKNMRLFLRFLKYGNYNYRFRIFNHT